MNAPLPRNFRYDIQNLIDATTDEASRDRVGLRLTQEQWGILSSYVQPLALAAGQILIAQGASDRTLYFVESGSLTVHFQDLARKIHLALVGPGSVVGEGAFFTYQPRSATVQAGAPSKVWALSPLRFMELSKRQPEIALELVMRLGAVASTRLVHQRMRAAVT
jgi:CRP/FNR family cyclic AMP-dependent transcriptional regulator